MSERRPVRKVLVSNRGEIAVRVMRTCREMGISTVAVYSDADRGALHVLLADEAVRIGPPAARDSYLSIEAVLEAARRAGADAIHPGYGFLSEDARFARAVEAAGLTFIGPTPEAMEVMGLKTTARARMRAAGVPTVPGSEDAIADASDAQALCDGIGYPVMIKAVAGGGGKGMKRCDRPDDLASLWASARREAAAAFGDDRLYVEKVLDEPRHVEIQVIADAHGRCVHLGERECSVQRRHQKIVEESPSCVLDPALREEMGEVAVRAARAVGYRGAGTVEFLVDASRRFYFLEMNTRLQVEHPVTELCTGLDLVRLQIEVARGEPLAFTQQDVVRRGHAIEARIYAEDPGRGFLPSPGRITYLRVPGGPGVRDDSGVYAGWVVPIHYDPMLSKLVAWAPTREAAIERLRRALAEYVVHGVTVNVRYLERVLDHPAFRAGRYDTTFCARYAADLQTRADPALERLALAAAAVAAHRRDHEAGASVLPRAVAGGPGEAAQPAPAPGSAGGTGTWILELDGGRREEQVNVTPAGPGVYDVEVGGETLRLDVFAPDPSTLGLAVEGRSVPVRLDPRRAELRVEVLGSVFPIAGIHERS